MSGEQIKQGYKRTEVGVIPEDWGVSSIGAIADVEGGYAFSSKSFLTSGIYQIIKMSNLYGDSLDLERSAAFLDGLTEQEQHYLLKPFEIMLTLTGTTGKRDYGYSYMVTNEKNLLLNQRVGRLIVRSNSCPSYIFRQLRSSCFLKQFFNVSKGGTGNQTNVGTQDVAAMLIPLPPIAEQNAIAAALSDFDSFIDKLNQLIAKKHDLKQATMQQLLTGQTRLPGFSEEWEVKRLGDVVEIRKGQLITERDAIHGGIPVIAGGKKPSYFHNQPNRVGKTITVSASGASAGYVAFFDSPIFASDCSTISESKTYSIEFIYFQLLLKQDEIYRAQTGGAQPHIHAVDLMPLEVGMCSLEEQAAIAVVLSDIDAELDALEIRRDKNRALKQGLMQELLTGRIRLI